MHSISTVSFVFFTFLTLFFHSACQAAFYDPPTPTIHHIPRTARLPTSYDLVTRAVAKRNPLPTADKVEKNGKMMCSCNDGWHPLKTTVLNDGACTTTYCPDDPPKTAAAGGNACRQPSSDPCSPCYDKAAKACKMVITEKWNDCADCSYPNPFRGIKVYNSAGKLIDKSTMFWTQDTRLGLMTHMYGYKYPKSMHYEMKFDAIYSGQDRKVFWSTKDRDASKLPYAVKGKVMGASGEEQTRITVAKFECVCNGKDGC